jgi:hypothetical protein
MEILIGEVEVVPHKPPPVRNRPARPPAGRTCFGGAVWVRERRHNQSDAAVRRVTRTGPSGGPCWEAQATTMAEGKV